MLTIGPIARAGKKFNAPRSSAVPVSNTPKVIPSEGIVPGLGGRRDTGAAKRPAKANASNAKTYRPINMAMIVVIL